MGFLELSDSILFCKGIWSKIEINSVQKEFLSLKFETKNIDIDLQNITKVDTAGAMFLLYMYKRMQKKGIRANFINANKNVDKLIKLCQANDKPFTKKQEKFGISDVFYKIGEKSYGYFNTLISFLSFVGGVTKSLLKIIINPFSWRFKATLFHMQKNGLNAVPIISLTSLLIGVVIAFQGAVQLQKFGANIFIVEMIGVSATRELAPLIVAIVIAGRSASAYTAELGVMKITQEVDAMKTMGFSPWDFLILPRVVALIIVLPLLVMFADFVSIFGGMIVAKTQLDISFYEFVNRFKNTVDLKHILIGLVKAPIFGWIISVIGCFRGFEINSSTQSVGKYTTISVVNAIFWVIAFDAFASVFLTRLDL